MTKARVFPGTMQEAVKWYRKAAEQGDANAQNSLGVMYYKGEGVPRDHQEAVKWYRKAAEQGHAGAQFNLGLMYHQGEGVPKNATEAVRWWRKAAEQGTASAQVNLGLMYLRGEGVPKNATEAVKWFRRAAERGDAQGQLNLGAMYANGEGVPRGLSSSTEVVRPSSGAGGRPSPVKPWRDVCQGRRRAEGLRPCLCLVEPCRRARGCYFLRDQRQPSIEHDRRANRAGAGAQRYPFRPHQSVRNERPTNATLSRAAVLLPPKGCPNWQRKAA